MSILGIIGIVLGVIVAGVIGFYIGLYAIAMSIGKAFWR